MNIPLVYVIILSYNGEKWLKNCLDSLIRSTYANIKILIVDNCSSDNSIEIVERYVPSCELNKNKRNLGFAAGMNEGIKQALSRGAEYVFLLNQDTVVDTLCVEKLVEAAQHYHKIGVIAPVQLRYGTPHLHAIFAKWLMINVGQSDIAAIKHRQLLVVKDILGAAMLISREAIETVGAFDPYYFTNFEETDLCRRMRFHGYFNALCPQAIFWHDENIFCYSKEIPMMRSHVIFYLKDPYKNIFQRNILALAISCKNIIRIFYNKKYYLLQEYVKSLLDILINLHKISSRRYAELKANNIVIN